MPQEETVHIQVPVHIPSANTRRMTANLTSMAYGKVLITVHYNGGDESCQVRVMDILSYEDICRGSRYPVDRIADGLEISHAFQHEGVHYNLNIVPAETNSLPSREPRSVYLVEHQESFGKWTNVAAYYNMNMATEHKNEILARFFAESASEEELAEVFGEGYEPDQIEDDAYILDARARVEQIESWQMRYMDFGCYRVREVQVQPGGIS